MPLYPYTCEACGLTEERLVAIQDRDSEFTCPNCEGRMSRQLSAAKLGTAKVPMGAVLADGTHVRGHFGREAPRKRKG